MYAEARELAAGAADVVLAVHVLASGRISMLSAEMARTGPGQEQARQALGLAFQAQEEGRYIPTARLHALIALRHAGAAWLRAIRPRFQAAISQARRELDRSPSDSDPPEWLQFVDQTEITATEARGWLTLGDARRSARLYRQALADVPGTRNRASYGAGLRPARAAEAGRPPGRGSRGGRRPARARSRGDIDAVPEPAPHHPPGGRDHHRAQEFCERFDAIERA